MDKERNSQNQQVVYPDEVILEGESNRVDSSSDRNGIRGWMLRALCLRGLITSSLLATILLIASMAMTLGAACGAFLVPELNRLFRTFWSFYRSTSMVSWGCFIGLCFPVTGLKIIAGYLTLVAGHEYANFLSNLILRGKKV